jgi:hypothetical protein
MNCENKKISTRQENEFNALKMKMNAQINEFTLKRKAEFEKLETKFANRLRDLAKLHQYQLNELHSASKVTVIKSDKFTDNNKNSKSLRFSPQSK